MLDLGLRRSLTLAIRERLTLYWSLIKSLQTGLLLFTGMAGLLSAGADQIVRLPGLSGALLLAISGSTVLNMLIDRDIDAVMERTAGRPLPSGRIDPWEALLLGLLLSVAGLGWALHLSLLCALVVGAGLFFDVVIYSAWLKRRSPWSILWGGISGGMPVLAGRVLACGQIDAVGLLLAVAVLFWIPTHIMSFGIKAARDYERAGVPIFPNRYGVPATRRIIAVSTLMAALIMCIAAWQIGLPSSWMLPGALLGLALSGLALFAALRPSERLTHILFRCASLYMIGAMALVIAGALLG